MSHPIRSASDQQCRFRRHQHLARAGEARDAIFCIEEGWAGRYTMLGSGRRQITALYLPGDFCEPQWLIRPRSSEAVIALTPVRARRVPLNSAINSPGHKTEATKLLGATLSLLERQSAWIVSLGRKTAIERVCTVLTELLERLGAQAGPQRDRIAMPLTQAELADVVGLTPIHVNRVFKLLKTKGVIKADHRTMTVLDQDALRAIAACG